MQLSVIILTYKVPYYLLQCLESVQKSIKNIAAEIIVVDNNSEDQSCQLVKKFFPEVILIENKDNLGFSKGNNQGVALARGKNICLLNPDTIVGENLFSNLLNFAEKHPDFGAIGPKLIDGTGNFLPESKRNLPTPFIALQKLFNFNKNYYSPLKENETGNIEIMSGACMFMQKKRYLEIGGLDEDYFMYGEDIDLSYKFLKAKYTNYYLGTSTIIHYKGESTLKDATYRKRFYGAMEIFYRKHFKKNSLTDFAVKSALQLASFRNSLQKEKSSAKRIVKKSYWVGGSDPKTLPQNFSIPVYSIPAEKILVKKPFSSYVIFNAEIVPFEEIIKTIETLKNRNNCFRIKPAGFNFVVGSDHHTNKGEVVHF